MAPTTVLYGACPLIVAADQQVRSVATEVELLAAIRSLAQELRLERRQVDEVHVGDEGGVCSLALPVCLWAR
eukprot:12894944-Prorocentrum_lima.AAC.1